MKTTRSKTPKRPEKGRNTKASGARVRPAPKAKAKAGRADVRAVVAWLERRGSQATREGMARYSIPSDKAFGISVGTLRRYAKTLGRQHELAAGLWDTGWYEARMLATFVDDPASVTPAQMDRWCADFDNWAICDTACFQLFDRTAHAWDKIRKWSRRREEFVKRAAFALLASMTVHDREADDAAFEEGLALIERAAEDERNFVSKAVNWALRSIGKKNRALNVEATAVAARLAASENPAARWVGKNALRELTSPAVQARLRARGR